MRVAKLSTDKIVLFMKDPTQVGFSPYPQVLVSNILTTNPRRLNPYWVPATSVVWVLDFKE